MKKIFTFLGGVVFSIALLNASLPLPEPGPDQPKIEKPANTKSLDKVKILLRFVKTNEGEKLSMTDSNGGFSFNDLTTDVNAGAVVIWKLDELPGIVSIDSVYAESGGKSFFRSTKIMKSGKVFQLKVSKDAHGTVKYIIVFTTSGRKQIKIDPFLRVPPPPDPER